jgi:hypothetical protein
MGQQTSQLESSSSSSSQQAVADFSPHCIDWTTVGLYSVIGAALAGGFSFFQQGTRPKYGLGLGLPVETTAFDLDPALDQYFRELETYRYYFPEAYDAGLRHTDTLLFREKQLLQKTVVPQLITRSEPDIFIALAMEQLNKLYIMSQQKKQTYHALKIEQIVKNIKAQCILHRTNILKLCDQYMSLPPLLSSSSSSSSSSLPTT